MSDAYKQTEFSYEDRYHELKEENAALKSVLSDYYEDKPQYINYNKRRELTAKLLGVNNER